MGEYENSLHYMEESHKQWSQLSNGAPNSHLATCLNNLGFAYRNMNLYRVSPALNIRLNRLKLVEQEALINMEKALEMRQTLYKDQLHQEVADSFSNKGVIGAVLQVQLQLFHLIPLQSAKWENWSWLVAISRRVCICCGCCMEKTTLTSRRATITSVSRCR